MYGTHTLAFQRIFVRMKIISLIFIRFSYVSLIRNGVTGPLQFSTLHFYRGLLIIVNLLFYNHVLIYHGIYFSEVLQGN
jgi:hypothetical protein